LTDAKFHVRKGEDGFDGGKNKIVETRGAGEETKFLSEVSNGLEPSETPGRLNPPRSRKNHGSKVKDDDESSRCQEQATGEINRCRKWSLLIRFRR
jgi:hypothetical protein